MQSTPPTRTDNSPTVPAIILAAGESRRLGRPKQLLRLEIFAGRTLLEQAAHLAHCVGISPIFIVLGAHAEQIQRNCDLSHYAVLKNEEWASGMASSLQTGILAAMQQTPSASGALLMVCDQPALSTEHLHRLLAAHRAEPQIVAASRYAGKAGVPAIVPRELFSALLGLRGDQGARAVFQQLDTRINTIEFANGDWDIDTDEDLQQMK